MKAGDLIKVGHGAVTAFDLDSPFVILLDRVPRTDYLEYDWKCLAGSRQVMMGRQIEDSCDVIVSNSKV